MRYTCPVCGYPDLRQSPRSNSGGGSYEICPSCGFQFGVSDDDQGFTYASWRSDWQKRGSPWSSHGVPPPDQWEPKSQLRALLSTTSQLSDSKSKK